MPNPPPKRLVLSSLKVIVWENIESESESMYYKPLIIQEIGRNYITWNYSPSEETESLRSSSLETNLLFFFVS